MNAPISRVLPTPVARAKQSDGNLARSPDRRKLGLDDLQGLGRVGRFLEIDDLADTVQNLQRLALRRAKAQAIGDGVDVLKAHSSPPSIAKRSAGHLAVTTPAGGGG